jgi:very-short-patch-repair endonuclease
MIRATPSPLEGEGVGWGVRSVDKQIARRLRKNPTAAELVLWKRLRLRQAEGNKFRRQHRLGSYVVDFICLEKKLIVEVDGGHHADTVKTDLERTKWLESRGYKVLRFWNNDVLKDIDAICKVVFEALGNPPPPSSPSRGAETT